MQTTQLNFTDTHCHLYAAEFDGDREEMVQRAIDSGVRKMMMPNIDPDSIPLMLRLSNTFPGHCFPMMGLHPCSVKPGYQAILDRMKTELQTGAYTGIGETGVDLYWDVTHRDLQIDAFEQHIKWAKEMDLPVIIHSRDSLALNLEIIQKHQDGTLRGIFHCFGGDYDQGLKIFELGFKAGIGGILTFKNSILGEVLSKLPKEIIVLETDAPYLAPVPYRGKRNEPSYLMMIAEYLSKVLGISMVELAELTTSNAMSVFGKKG